MAGIYEFNKQLKYSFDYADAPWWQVIYREMWPDAVAFTCVRKDGQPQREGVDRLITRACGIVHKVDEKVRRESYPDILLEFLSDVGRNKPGWVAKDLACDGIAYARVPSRDCYYLPTTTLQRAWRLHGEQWRKRYRVVQAFTPERYSQQCYKTLSVAVPIPVLQDALGDACYAQWTPDQDLPDEQAAAAAKQVHHAADHRSVSAPPDMQQRGLFDRLPFSLKPPRGRA